jgi:NitT/TauT family transport system ATP-binding protein
MKLEVRDLEKIYRGRHSATQALAPISFHVRDGEFVSLLGPSGCGKSTTLYALAGLDEPTRGEILLDGERVRGPGRDRGMVFQNYTLFPWLNVLDNTRFSFELEANVDRSASTAKVMTQVGRAYALLDLMGLSSFHRALPRELSGGMKQRVAIARALTNRPKVLLMDEPFGALDSQTREEMQDMMLLLHAHEKTTVIFVTHDVEEALYLSTRILVFSPRPGRIIRDLAVPFGPAREPALKLTPEFMRLKRDLVDLLRQPRDAEDSRGGRFRKLITDQNQPATSHP